MKMTQGYVTDDGTFFESQNEAALHEAEWLLRGRLTAAFPQIGQDGFIEVVLEVLPALKGYIDAYQAIQVIERDQQAQDEDRGAAADGAQAKVDLGPGHVSSTEEDLAALLKLPARGRSHVPDVGSGPRPKKVSDRRKVDGTGSGGTTP